jgi:hypothetical protein
MSITTKSGGGRACRDKKPRRTWIPQFIHIGFDGKRTETEIYIDAGARPNAEDERLHDPPHPHALGQQRGVRKEGAGAVLGNAEIVRSGYNSSITSMTRPSARRQR